MGFVWVGLESFKTSPVIKLWVLEIPKTSLRRRGVLWVLCGLVLKVLKTSACDQALGLGKQKTSQRSFLIFVREGSSLAYPLHLCV